MKQFEFVTDKSSTLSFHLFSYASSWHSNINNNNNNIKKKKNQKIILSVCHAGVVTRQVHRTTSPS
jgi:hypothetical protein